MNSPSPLEKPGPRTPHLLELTSTRFFAAMAVLLGHFQDFLGLPKWLTLWIAGGYGVSFFFVLSGFILTYVYWDQFAPGVDGRGFRRYFVARVARIYPSYVLALVLITLVYVAASTVRPGAVVFPGNTITSWFVNLFALQTFARSYETQQYWNAPAWSISTEFGFYVMFPFILAVIARYFRSLRGLLVVFGLTVAWGILWQSATLVLVFKYGWNREFWLDIVASRNIFWRLPEFMTGVVAARLVYGGHLKALQSKSGLRNALLAAGLVGVSLLNIAPWPNEAMPLLVMRQFRFDMGYMIPFAAIVLALAAGPTFASPLLTRPSWVFLGDISYGIYIYHWIPWTLLTYAKSAGFQLSPWLVTGVLVATIMFSAASYLWYEKPVRLFIRKKLGP